MSEYGIIWKQLRKLIQVIDELRDIGVHQYIRLPRIATLGMQSSGKSSVLENIVGLDFLPKGSGLVTRRPLELRLHHLNDPGEKPWATFDEIPGEKYTDFLIVRKKIDEVTDKVAGKNKGIVDIPIILHIYSPTCPDMSLIDLPGITRIKLKGSDHPDNIEEITKNMSLKYVTDFRTIILCVIPANIDITTSEALQISQFVDPQGLRTIGVITKVDIMNHGTNAKRTLLGEDVALRLGFVGVKLRSQQDIIDSKSVQEALEEESKYFASHPVYSAMGPGYTGTKTLSNKLTKILFTHIKYNLPDIIKEISARIHEIQDRLSELGPPMPEEPKEKLQMAWTMVIKFCDTFKDAIAGKFVESQTELRNLFQGGASIKIMYYHLLKEYSMPDFKIMEEYNDTLIENAILLSEGDGMIGFPSADVFVSLIQPQIEKLKDPCLELIQDVYNYLENVANNVERLTFLRFPIFGEEIMEKIIEFMVEERENTRYLVESIIKSETIYMFTNDPEYLISRTSLLPGTNTEPNDIHEEKKESSQQIKKTKKEKAMLFVSELRARLDAYFRIVVKNLRDTVPRLIGNFLVRKVQKNMEIELFKRLGNMSDTMNKYLGEPVSIIQKRKELNIQLDTLNKAERILTRDPEITSLIGSADDELLVELRKKKAEDFKDKYDEDQKFSHEETKYFTKESQGDSVSQKKEVGILSIPSKSEFPSTVPEEKQSEKISFIDKSPPRINHNLFGTKSKK